MVGFVVTTGREGKALTMPVRRDPRTGGWYFRTTVKTPDGKQRRIFGTAGVPGPYQDLAATEVGAKAAEQRAIVQAFADAAKAEHPPTEREEVPTFGDWFKGRFWREWVIAQKNKPTEVRSKEIIYRLYLEPRYKDTPLDKIDVSAIAQLRADLVDAELSEKRSNNILAVLSKPLHYLAKSRPGLLLRRVADRAGLQPAAGRLSWARLQSVLPDAGRRMSTSPVRVVSSMSERARLFPDAYAASEPQAVILHPRRLRLASRLCNDHVREPAEPVGTRWERDRVALAPRFPSPDVVFDERAVA
jgi:hypothetical protein